MFLIADNQDITRAGLHNIVETAFVGSVCKDVTDKRELVSVLESEGNGCVVVFDYELFDFNGFDDFLILRDRFPNASWLVFSNELSETFLRNAAAHSLGIVLKDCSRDEIVTALQYAVEGKRYLCQTVSNLLLENEYAHSEKTPLTPTEIEILKLIAHGLSVKEIAAKRISSVHTITTHKKNIFRKLGVNNVYEATKYALRAGLIEMMEYYI